jgi:ubiquinone/menaquinone biosynthesis C-methylase UbiE
MTLEPRSAYKSVWTALSTTNQQAIAHVIGEVDEAAIQAAAQHTKHWLNVSVGIRRDDVILEIGCGIGRVGQVLAPICKQWIGCDVSPNMLRHARERLSDFSNVRFVELSGYDLRPIQDASVNLVYCTVVFMHLDEWERYNYILEACRVLHPGGRVFIDNFNLCSDEGWDIFETHRQVAPADRPPHMARASTPQEIEAYFRRAKGFQDIQVRENGAWIQAYAVKSDHEGGEPALIFPEVNESRPENFLHRLVDYEQELKRLHAVVAEKNVHIQRLERLLARIENGRVMRLLRWVRRG